MNLQTLSLFPTAVMKGNIGRSLTKEELSIIDYHSDKTILNFGNVTSEEHYILNKHPELKDLKQYIEEQNTKLIESGQQPRPAAFWKSIYMKNKIK
jgi:hypothetical protein